MKFYDKMTLLQKISVTLYSPLALRNNKITLLQKGAKMTPKICLKPFKKLEIDSFGNVYTCCPCYINCYNISNIFDENIKSIEDIWNSEKAKNLREKMMKGDYSFCNFDICREPEFVENDGSYTTTPDLPEIVTLSYDKVCNIQCITCRNEIIKKDAERTEKVNEKLDSIIIPLLKNTKELTISGSGEALYSKHSRELIKKLTKTNESIKFVIYTNGILFNEQNCKILGLTNRVQSVFVSMHAFHKEIYDKIMIGSNLTTVMKNLEYISEMKKQNKINMATINCVISDINYKEIPYMIDYAKSLDIDISFSIYTPWGADLDKNYDELAVWEPTHKNYKDFVDVIKQAKNAAYKNCRFAPAIEKVLA